MFGAHRQRPEDAATRQGITAAHRPLSIAAGPCTRGGSSLSRPVVVVLVAALLGGAVPAAKLPRDPLARPEVAVEDPPILPLAQVKQGMRGKGFTVFSSVRGPEPFEFEVLGILRSYLGPGEDLIVARLIGEQIEKTGVISGMSGSPAYVDGKLIGAVGYRFGQFTKEPIAGITPIERMLTVAEPSKAAKPSPAGGGAGRGRTMSAWGAGEPIATPVAVSGVFPSVLEAFRPEFEKRGYGPLVAAAGGSSSGRSPGPAQRLFAGGPIAGTLVDGDIAMAGIGTVTWVKGDRFLAFGHPFFGGGVSDMPVSNAEIVTTVASESGSWKMGQATAPLGRLSDDRLHAIAGDMGTHPSTMPVTVRIQTEGPRAAADALTKQSFRVMHHDTDMPLYTAVALANALTSRVGGEKGGTVRAKAKVTLSTGDTVDLEWRAAEDGAPLEVAVALRLLGHLTEIVEQDFADVELRAVDVEVIGESAVQRARVLSVDAPKKLMPGEPGEVRVRLQPWQGPQVEKRVSVRLPRALPAGTYTIVAAGEGFADRVESEGGMRAIPTSFDAHLRVLKSEPPPGSLSLYLVTDKGGLRLDGVAIPDLPPSMAGILSEGGGLSGAPLESRALRLARTIETGVVAGEARTKITIAEAASSSADDGE